MKLVEMITMRKDMESLGYFTDSDIRDAIRKAMTKSVRTTVRKPAVVRKPAAPRVKSAVAVMGPQARVDRIVIGGTRMGPTFCGMCADHHAPGEHTL